MVMGEAPFSLKDIPTFSGVEYIEVNNNVPYLDAKDLSTKSFEHYSDLDSLGRCGTASACIELDIMPTEERGSIGQVKPSGWQISKYDFVDGKYLYNRCHLIGYQLTGENANTSNLITGTRYMNIEGMLPFENQIASYVKNTGNHVAYRVTPVFDGDNLVATGVLMEALSIEDNQIAFCVFVYNAQPSVGINYKNGDNWLLGDDNAEQVNAKGNPSEATTPKPMATQASLNGEKESELSQTNQSTYVLNTNTKKFHYPYCSSVEQMSVTNRKIYEENREDVIGQGYTACKRCNP